MLSIIYVGIGGFIGAVFRFLLSNTIQGSTRFPLGTLGVNILGAFTLSLITYSSEKAFALPDSSRLFLTVGLLGASQPCLHLASNLLGYLKRIRMRYL